MKTGKLYGVGIGPGDPQYLTLRAADVLRSVDVVFTVISPNASNSVSQSVVDYLQPRGEVRLQVFSMSRDKTIREEKVQVLYGEHLAMKEQALLTDPDAIRARPEKYLSLIMVKKQ